MGWPLIVQNTREVIPGYLWCGDEVDDCQVLTLLFGSLTLIDHLRFQALDNGLQAFPFRPCDQLE